MPQEGAGSPFIVNSDAFRGRHVVLLRATFKDTLKVFKIKYLRIISRFRKTIDMTNKTEIRKNYICIIVNQQRVQTIDFRNLYLHE